jgi:hypothetical protein
MPHLTDVADIPIVELRARPDRQDDRTLSEFRYPDPLLLGIQQSGGQPYRVAVPSASGAARDRGVPGRPQSDLGRLAERPKIRHHSAVELADGLAEAGLIE